MVCVCVCDARAILYVCLSEDNFVEWVLNLPYAATL